MRVMMSAAASPVAHGIIRYLQSLGHYVIGHDCSPYGYAADEFHVSPPADTSPSAFLTFLGGIERDIYLPFLDEELRLWPCQDLLGAVISPDRTLHTFTSKRRQQRALADAGLPVAPLAIVGECICKPDRGRGGKRNIRTDDNALADLLEQKGWVTQQFIDGDEFTIDVLVDRDHILLWAVSRQRLVANGVSIVGKIVNDDELLELACRVTNAFPFCGPINIQVIREKGTGKLYIIEVNPRLSGSCMFTVMAGFDILTATIRMHLGLPFTRPEDVAEITIRRHYVEERYG